MWARAIIADLTPLLLKRIRRSLLQKLRTDQTGPRDYNDAQYAEILVSNQLRTRAAGVRDYERCRMILPAIVSQFESPTVLDFGGGAAFGLFDITDNILDAKFNYVLVDTPAMCEAVNGKLLASLDRPIEVRSEIPTSLPAPLIINASSSLQYAPRDAARKLSALSPAQFIVSRAPMTDEPEWSWDQDHTFGKISAKIFNRTAFLAEMQSFGYKCVLMSQDPAPAKDGPPFRYNMIFSPI